MSEPHEVLATILRELVEGSPVPGVRTYVLNQGDPGFLASLDRLTAAAASVMPTTPTNPTGGASIAAHVDHLRYGLSLLNRWAGGDPPPWPDMDFTASWRRSVVSEAGWRTLRDELRREASRWIEVLRSRRDASGDLALWMAGSVAHLAYHFGAIRQIDRATRGPTAEDEERAQGKRSA